MKINRDTQFLVVIAVMAILLAVGAYYFLLLKEVKVHETQVRKRIEDLHELDLSTRDGDNFRRVFPKKDYSNPDGRQGDGTLLEDTYFEDTEEEDSEFFK